MSDSRRFLLMTSVALAFVVVAMRLVDLMVLKHESLQERAWSQQVGTRELNENRGIIYDRRGRKLVVNIDTFAVSANPREISDPVSVSSMLALYTGEPSGAIQKKLSSGKGFVWIKRNLDFDAGMKLKELKLEGVQVKRDVRRAYPRNEYGSHVVGFLNVDNVAQDGVERSYDEVLRGEDKSVVVARDRAGRAISEGAETESWGNGVVLTIDYGLQIIVEDALKAAVENAKAKAGAVVMMDPRTGEILALANWPTFNPNDLSGTTPDAWRDRAVSDLFEPGSTFKIVAASAALERGLVTPDSTFDTGRGFIKIYDRVIRDTHEGGGVLDLRHVIKYSSNVGTILMSRTLSHEDLHSFMTAYGFGQKSGIDLPGEHPGVVRPVKQWSETSHAAMSIGYEVAVTPVQVLRAYSVIANGGLLVTPHIVSRVLAPDGALLYKVDPDAQGAKRVVSERTASLMRDMLIGVTEEGGTGTAASVMGDDVAGKTGTTRVFDAEHGQYSTSRYVGSFVGFLPAEDPKVALIVVIFEPSGKHYYGGLVAAPAFKEIAERSLAYLNVAPRHPKDEVVAGKHGNGRRSAQTAQVRAETSVR